MKSNKHRFFQLMIEHPSELIANLDQDSKFKNVLLKRKKFYQYIVKLLEKRIFELVKGDLSLEDEIYAKLLDFFACYIMENGCIYYKCFDDTDIIDFSFIKHFYYITTLYKKGKKKRIRFDYFLPKDVRQFLVEELHKWMTEEILKDLDILNERNIAKLRIFEEIILYAIDLIAQFEDKLLELWQGPREIINAEYVITFNKITKQGTKAQGILKAVFSQLKDQYALFSENKARLEIIKQKHKRYPKRFEEAKEVSDQFSEWFLLELIDADFVLDDLWTDNQTQLNPKYAFLPLDTRFFPGLKTELEKLYTNIEEALDGYLIKGDNLQVMQSLLTRFEGRIQLTYIDPPFNASTSKKDYDNVFKIETWLIMLNNRLELIKRLLADTGSLYLHLNPKSDYLARILLNIIFGPENFKNELIWKRTTYKQTQTKSYGAIHDTILYYGKSKNTKWTDHRLDYDSNHIKRYFRWVETPDGKNIKLSEEQLSNPELIPEGKRFALNPLLNPSSKRPNLRYEFLGFTKTWKYTKAKMLRLYEQGLIFQPSQGKLPQIKQYLHKSKGMKLNDLWTDISAVMGSSGEYLGFETQKPEGLLKRLILTSTEPKDYVLDLFLGSGTTAAVAQKLQRKWIGIESGEHFWHVVLPRMKKVLGYDRNGISKDKDVALNYNANNAGGFFKYVTLEQFEDLLNKHF